MQRDEKQRKLLVIGYGPCGKTSLISRYVNQSSARAVLSSPSELPSSELASVPSVLLSEVSSGYDPTIVERYCRQDTITLPQDKVPLNNMMIAVESEAISNPIQAITFIVTIIDTSGNDEFESLVLPEYVDCDAFLILYAVDDIMSFERIARFRQLIVSTRMKDESRTNDSGGQIHHLPPVVLVGNKSDLPVEQWRVSKEMADSCAQNYYKNCSHAPVNALLNTIPVLHRHISAHFSCLLDINEIFHAVLRALMVKNGCPFPHHEEKHLGVLDCQALGSESLKVQQQEQQRGFTYVPGRSIGIVPEEVYMTAVKERPSNVVDQDDDAEALPPPDTPPPEDDDDDDEEQKDVSTPASMNGCKSNVRVLPHATAKESVPDRTAQKKCDRIPEESKPCDRKQKNHALKTESFEKTGDKQENRMNDKVALLNYKYSTPPSDGHFSYDSEGSLYHPINSCDTQGTRRTEIERFLPMQSHSKTNIFKKAWEVITCGCC